MATYDSTLRLAHANKLDFSTTFLYYLDNITWKVIPLLQEPVSVNYTIDDSSDNATIRFISTTLERKLDNGSFVTLVYAPDTSTKSLFGIPAYDGVGKPSNHDVLVVKNGKCYQKGNATIWYHEYQCVELIELLKEVTMETLTFSSDEQVTVQYAGAGTSTTYYKSGYNALTILERILKLTRTPTSVEDNSWYNKIDIYETAWLSTEMIGVDDTFNENTLYDALIKIGGYLGRYPVLYFNPNYNGTNEQFNLYFEKRAINRNSPVTLASLIANASDYIESDDSQIAQSVVANAQNLIGSKVVYYPSKNQYAPANNKDLEALTVGAADDLCLVLDYPISQVIELKKLVYVVQYIDSVKQTPTETYSTIPCFKYEDWLVQENRNSKAYFKENENIIYFGINLSLSGQGYTFISEGTTEFTYHFFQVQAYTNIQASAYVGDSEYSQFFNQTDSLVDSSTFAKQVKNYQEANSGSDWTISKVVDDYADILLCGQLVTDNADEYVIGGVSFNTFTFNGKVAYKVAYQLNRDVVRRNLFIRARDGVRNYQTYYENTHERFINLKEKITIGINFGTAGFENSENTFKYITEPKVVMGGLLANEPMVETAFIKTTSVVNTAVDGTTTETFNKYLQFNCNKTQFGNSVLLNMRALTNVGVGNSVGEVSSGIATQTQRQAIYTDPFGCVQEMQVGISSEIEQDIMGYNFPVVDSSDYSTYYANSFIKIPTLYIDKDSREIINLTLQFDFEGLGETIISPDFVAYTGLLGNRDFADFTGIFKVINSVAGYYEIGDLLSGTEYTMATSFYETVDWRGVTLAFATPITLIAGREYFIVNAIGSSNKIIAKIDTSEVSTGTFGYLTIYF